MALLHCSLPSKLVSCSKHWPWYVQAELLQQEIINRQRLSIAADRLLADLPKQAQAAEERMFMAEYVRGYQLVSALPSHELM